MDTLLRQVRVAHLPGSSTSHRPPHHLLGTTLPAPLMALFASLPRGRSTINYQPWQLHRGLCINIATGPQPRESCGRTWLFITQAGQKQAGRCLAAVGEHYRVSSNPSSAMYCVTLGRLPNLSGTDYMMEVTTQLLHGLLEDVIRS